MLSLPSIKPALLATLIFTSQAACQYATTSLPIRIITHNIRYAATSLFDGEAPWSTRRPLVVNQLRFTASPPASFICMQEVLHSQLTDIISDLNAGNTTSEWAYLGVGRDDGAQAGEYAPLFYRPSAWTPAGFRTVWLSETPDVPSKGWDAGSVRILSIASFVHVATAQRVVAMCTHLDNEGSVARLNAARIIVERIRTYSGLANGTAPFVPVLLAGDFNSEMGQEAYEEMRSAESPVEDLRLQLPEGMRYGNVNTFTGFTDDTSDDSLIDFLWLGPKNQGFWGVKEYAVLANKFGDGVYNSDHRIVVGDVVLNS